jgi:hypothetical protein
MTVHGDLCLGNLATEASAVGDQVSASRRRWARSGANVLSDRACNWPRSTDNSPARYCWVIPVAAGSLLFTRHGSSSLVLAFYAFWLDGILRGCGGKVGAAPGPPFPRWGGQGVVFMTVARHPSRSTLSPKGGSSIRGNAGARV